MIPLIQKEYESFQQDEQGDYYFTRESVISVSDMRLNTEVTRIKAVDGP